MLEMRRKSVVVQEWDLSCGAAALATLLRYQHNDPVSERELLQILISRDIYLETPEMVQIQQGFSLLDLQRAAESRGFNGFGYGSMTLEDALQLAPIITPISPNGYNHFVVLLGRRGDRLLVADPAFGNIAMRQDRFERAWLDLPELGYVGFIVTRGDQPAPPGRLQPDPRVFLLPPLQAARQSLF